MTKKTKKKVSKKVTKKKPSTKVKKPTPSKKKKKVAKKVTKKPDMKALQALRPAGMSPSLSAPYSPVESDETMADVYKEMAEDESDDGDDDGYLN